MVRCGWRTSKLAPVCGPKSLFARLALTPGGRACCSRDVHQCYGAVKAEVWIARVQLCQSVQPLCHAVPPLATGCPPVAQHVPVGEFAVLLGDEYRVLYGISTAMARIYMYDAPVFVMVLMVLVMRYVGVPSEGAWRLRMPA
jgi:hypothetical protein